MMTMASSPIFLACPACRREGGCRRQGSASAPQADCLRHPALGSLHRQVAGCHLHQAGGSRRPAPSPACMLLATPRLDPPPSSASTRTPRRSCNQARISRRSSPCLLAHRRPQSPPPRSVSHGHLSTPTRLPPPTGPTLALGLGCRQRPRRLRRRQLVSKRCRHRSNATHRRVAPPLQARPPPPRPESATSKGEAARRRCRYRTRQRSGDASVALSTRLARTCARRARATATFVSAADSSATSSASAAARPRRRPPRPPPPSPRPPSHRPARARPCDQRRRPFRVPRAPQRRPALHVS